MFLICGEARLDFTPEKPGREALIYSARPGGAGYAIAAGIARQGGSAALFTALSGDEHGAFLRERLAAEGVSLKFLPAPRGKTALDFGQRAGGAVSYDQRGAGQQICDADLPDLPDEVTGLHFAGCAALREPAAGAFLALAEREAGRRIISVSPGEAVVADDAMMRLADILILSAGSALPDDAGAALTLCFEESGGARLSGAFGEVSVAAAPGAEARSEALTAALLAQTGRRFKTREALTAMTRWEAEEIARHSAAVLAAKGAEGGVFLPRWMETGVGAP